MINYKMKAVETYARKVDYTSNLTINGPESAAQMNYVIFLREVVLPALQHVRIGEKLPPALYSLLWKVVKYNKILDLSFFYNGEVTELILYLDDKKNIINIKTGYVEDNRDLTELFSGVGSEFYSEKPISTYKYFM